MNFRFILALNKNFIKFKIVFNVNIKKLNLRFYSQKKENRVFIFMIVQHFISRFRVLERFIITFCYNTYRSEF